MLSAGQEGLSVWQASRLVYNAVNTFFEPIDFDGVHKSVAQYLRYHSRRSDSLFCKVSRGVYRLNPRAKEMLQYKLEFGDDDIPASDEPQTEEQSLPLF